MKKTLLFASVLLTGTTFAQFTQGNEPEVGDTQTMFVCDETAPDYATVTGTGVTWDYSTTAGDHDAGIPAMSVLSIVDAASTTEGSNFTAEGATKAVVIEGFMSTYFSSTASTRTSQGFSFDNSGTMVNVVLDTDPETLMNYTFNQGNTVSDAFGGHSVYMGAPITVTGTSTATVDGTGTLKLNAATTIPNVVRYKLTDNASGTAGFIPISLARTQYEYYDLANSSLPLFVHSTLVVTIASAPNVIKVVLNSEEPDDYLSVNENELAGLTVYPNPATDEISVKGLKENASLTLVDAQGKTVATAAVEPGVASLSVANVNAGVYFLHIASANGTKVERVVIR